MLDASVSVKVLSLPAQPRAADMTHPCAPSQGSLTGPCAPHVATPTASTVDDLATGATPGALYRARP
jgi:hypothetical protein